MEVQQGSKYIQLCRQRAVVSERCTQCHVIHIYMYMYIIYTCTCIVYMLFNTPHVHVPVLKAGHPAIICLFVWAMVGWVALPFFKLVCYAHVFPCFNE